MMGQGEQITAGKGIMMNDLDWIAERELIRRSQVDRGLMRRIRNESVIGQDYVRGRHGVVMWHKKAAARLLERAGVALECWDSRPAQKTAPDASCARLTASCEADLRRVRVFRVSEVNWITVQCVDDPGWNIHVEPRREAVFPVRVQQNRMADGRPLYQRGNWLWVKKDGRGWFHWSRATGQRAGAPRAMGQVEE